MITTTKLSTASPSAQSDLAESEISVRGVGMRLGKHSILEDVNMDIRAGEFVCIVGPSGCGKTTLLNIIAGFLRPTSGEIRVRGEQVRGPDPRRVFVFQENGVFPWLTVVENIGLGLRHKPQAERNATVRHYLEMVGLVGFENAYPRELSGGMRQRVEIARALAANPDVIYMDEPFGALDYMTRLKMRSELTQIWQQERKTVVFVTHDIDEAVQLSDRVMVMGQRPSTCREAVTVALPRPRNLEAPEYLALCKHLMRSIDHTPSTSEALASKGNAMSDVKSHPSAAPEELVESKLGLSHSPAAHGSPDAKGPGASTMVEYLIVGAGPAGLQLSYFLKRAGLGHQVLDRASVPGAFFQTFPRHRKLISINKVHTGIKDAETNLRWDWNSLLSENGPLFTERTRRYFPDANELVGYLDDFAKTHELPITTDFDVREIQQLPGNSGFQVSAKDGRVVRSKKLIVATGVTKPWLPEFPGVEFCEPYTTVSVDPDEFTGQRVLILGKGNSAFETADNLMETTASIHLLSPNPLRMAWRTHFVGHLRAVNNNILDSYHLKSQNAILDAEVREIRREGNQYAVTLAYAHANGEVETLYYDRIIACTGFRFDADIFAEDSKPELKACGRLPAMTSEWESKNIPGLFFAGTIMQYRDYKKYMSGFIHGFRYNIRALTRILEQRYHQVAWPARAIARTPNDLTKAILDQANRSSSLWQQPGFLCDVIEVNGNRGSVDYMEEIPVDLAKEKVMLRGHWLMLTLEFGNSDADPFAIPRVSRTDTSRAAESTFLHPVVRYYVEGGLVAEHHVIEDLAAVWSEQEHFEPLLGFLSDVLSDTGMLPRQGIINEDPLSSSGTFVSEHREIGDKGKTSRSA